MSAPPLNSARSRADLVSQAFWLEWLTIAWMLIEAAVALWSGYVAHSITLIAFGLDSVIELISAGVLVWRLTVELRHGQAFSEEVEQRASKIGGALLFALAAYVVMSALWSLWTQRPEDFSMPGLLIALVAIPTMYFLAKRKIAIAEKIGSRALRADAVEVDHLRLAIGYGCHRVDGTILRWRVVGRFRHLARHRLVPRQGSARGLGRR